MLPVSAWPPGPPGASLSPFGKPRNVNICNGCCVLPKGAWIVNTGGSNRVVMFVTDWRWALFNQPTRQMGTGFLPGSPPNPGPTRKTHDQELEAWRAWQRATGCNDGPLWPPPGRTPPNWDGWGYVPAPSRTLVQPCASGLVVADGQNVVLTGSGCATIIEAFSV
jgi:hypothetical protein